MSEENYLQHEAFVQGKSTTSAPTNLPWILSAPSRVTAPLFNALLLLGVVTLFVPIILPVYFADSTLHAAVLAAGGSLPICYGNQAIVMAIQGGLICLCIIGGAGVLFKVADPFFVKGELTIMAVCYPVLYVIWMIATFSSAFPNHLSPFAVDLCLIFLSLIVSQLLPALMSFSFMDFSTSYDDEYRHFFDRRASEAALASGRKDSMSEPPPEGSAADMGEAGDSAFFKFVLENEVLGRSFEKFAVECRNTEALYFYRHVQMYRKIKDEGKRLQEAKRIGKEYLGVDAPLAINVPTEMKDEILSRIASGNSNPSLFHRAEVLVFIQMRHTAYPMWRRSKSFRIVVEQAGVKRPALNTDDELKPELDGNRTLASSIREALRKRLSSSIFGTRSSRGSYMTDPYASVNTFKGGSISSNYSMSDEPHLKKEPPRRPSIVWEKNEEDAASSRRPSVVAENERELNEIAEEDPVMPRPTTLQVPAEQVQEEILSKVEKRKSKPKFSPMEGGEDDLEVQNL